MGQLDVAGGLFVAVCCLLAGCASDADPAERPLSSAGAPAFDASTGAVSGVVVDVQELRLAGALVGLAGLETSARTADDGSFRLSHVPPGTHTVRAIALGHEQGQAEIEVAAGQVTEGVIVRLEPTASLVAYHETYLFDGLIECAWGVPVSSGNCVPLQFVFQQLGTNPTGTRIIGIYNVSDPQNVQQGVFEMAWVPASASTGSQLLLSVEQEFTGVVDGETYGSAEGTGPLRVVTGPEPFAPLPPEGGNVQTRTFPAGTVPPSFVLSQRFTVYASPCWNAPCADAFTALPE